jgi:hypothetical protein
MSIVKSGLTLRWQRDRSAWSQKLDEADRYLIKQYNLNVCSIRAFGLSSDIPL